MWSYSQDPEVPFQDTEEGCSLVFLKTLNFELQYEPAFFFLLLIVDPKSWIATRNKNVSRHFCISAHGRLFTIPQSQKQHKYTSTDDCAKKRCFIPQWNEKEENVDMCYKKNVLQKVVLGKLRMSGDHYCYKTA